MEVRRALSKEATTLTQITLSSKSYWNYPESWIQIWLPLLTISPEYLVENETWAAIVDEKPVAYYSLKHDDQNLWLDNLWVLPDFMGQGVGSFLFNHALERSCECGAVKLKTEADPHAQSFYEKMGMSKVDERWTEIDDQPRVLPVMEINLVTTYCTYCNSHPEDTFNKNYHDTQYGFPLNDDNALFERLVLEINQAGLSWITILKKAENFHYAYDSFEIEKIASYKANDRARLLADAGIIRNKLKVNAAIVNAQKILELRKEFGSFKGWLDAYHPRSKDEWVKLFKKNFIFTGGEIVNEFLVSAGYLPGAHDKDCPVYNKVASLWPAWMNK